MDESRIAMMMEQQMSLLKAAKHRKGQKATNKATRQQLLMQFGMPAFPSAMPHTVRSCQINHAYPPSITPLSGLKPITISELRLETHHIGRVLIVRTFTDPVRIQSIQSAVEDKNSEVDQLAVYNCDSKAPPDYMLPKDTVFAIKGPFYKAANNRGCIIRVDHLSDLVQLQPTHAMVPMELLPRLLELDKDALRSKTTGNAAFKKEYLKALDAYTEGLMCCSNDEDSLKRDLYHNRLIVNIYLHRYEAAFADATAAVIPNASDNETATRNNVRALFRAGRASYVLAAQYLSDDGGGIQHLEKTNARIQESEKGVYDFKAMGVSAGAGQKRLDYASFVKNVAVRAAGKKGRGLFTTKGIKTGEIILLEKAFSVAHGSECGDEIHVILNINTKTGRHGAHAKLFYQLCQLMLHNHNQAKPALDLFDSSYSPKCTAPIVDGKAVIDTFQVAAIMEHNAFGCPEKRNADEIGKQKESD